MKAINCFWNGGTDKNRATVFYFSEISKFKTDKHCIEKTPNLSYLKYTKHSL